MRTDVYFAITLAALLIGNPLPVLAQWSIGAPGTRLPPPGQHRYVYFVFSNPLPGHEAEFNDWYLNTHLGDLVQLKGFTGVQRFALEMSPRLSPSGYDSGYIALWDMQDIDIAPLRARMKSAIDGGKSRLGPGFNYNPGGWTDAFYETIGPRVTRPDGKGPFMPAESDNKSHRPNRYMFLEFTDRPVSISESDFVTAADVRIKQVLSLPGWMAAQRFVLLKLPQQHFEVLGDQGTNPLPLPRIFPKYLTIWEVEGSSAKASANELDMAVKAGRVSPLKANNSSAEASFWRPISPYVTKDLFER